VISIRLFEVSFGSNMKVDQFIICLKSLSLDEADEIQDFRHVDTVADINDLEFLLEYERLKSKETRPHKAQIKDSHKQTRDKHQAIVPLKKVSSEKKFNRRLQQSITRTSTPLLNRQKVHSKSVQFLNGGPEWHSHLPNNIKQKHKPPIRKLKDIKPKNDDLLDLVPPDIDVLNIDMDNLLLATPENDELDYDTVSCASSDGSYFTCTDDIDYENMAKSQPSDLGRPGIRIDEGLLGPPSSDTIMSLPKTNIFSCDKAKCGFTTSNPINIRLHSCRRF